MPQTVVLTGWAEGFRKIRLTKLIQERTDLGLADAKHRTDALLSGAEVRFEALDAAGDFLAEATKMGAVGHIEGDDGRRFMVLTSQEADPEPEQLPPQLVTESAQGVLRQLLDGDPRIMWGVLLGLYAAKIAGPWTQISETHWCRTGFLDGEPERLVEVWVEENTDEPQVRVRSPIPGLQDLEDQPFPSLPTAMLYADEALKGHGWVLVPDAEGRNG